MGLVGGEIVGLEIGGGVEYLDELVLGKVEFWLW
jgi:hypothetical protein